jgi:hypothetical protein
MSDATFDRNLQFLHELWKEQGTNERGKLVIPNKHTVVLEDGKPYNVAAYFKTIKSRINKLSDEARATGCQSCIFCPVHVCGELCVLHLACC